MGRVRSKYWAFNSFFVSFQRRLSWQYFLVRKCDSCRCLPELLGFCSGVSGMGEALYDALCSFENLPDNMYRHNIISGSKSIILKVFSIDGLLCRIIIESDSCHEK